jgi:hypothetical protein
MLDRGVYQNDRAKADGHDSMRFTFPVRGISSWHPHFPRVYSLGTGPPILFASKGDFEGRLKTKTKSQEQKIHQLRTDFPMRFIVRNMLLGCAGAVVMLTSAYSQEPPLRCPSPKNEPVTGKYAGYTVRLAPVSERGYRCQAMVKTPVSKSPTGKTVARDWALSIDPLSGTDVNGDGKPELIVQGFSGGAHCCYAYHIIRLSPGLPLVLLIANQVPISFAKRKEGGIELRTGDGVFDYFLVSQDNAVIPQLFLRLDGDRLVDVSADHIAEYDKQIDEARSQLTPAELDKLKHSTYSQNMLRDQMPAVRKAMTVVLNYLYSGREEQAWQALDEMWPPADATRVKQLILERRSRGLLFQAKPKAAAAK